MAKYVVGDKTSFVNKGKHYVSGDEISADIFSNKSDFDLFVKEGKIVALEEKKEEVKKTPSKKTSSKEGEGKTE